MNQKESSSSPDGRYDASQTSVRPNAAGESIQDAAGNLVVAATALRYTAESYLRDNTQKRPYVTLGVAAVVGFVLAGGLSSRHTGRVLAFGGRVFATKLLDGSLLSNLAQGSPKPNELTETR
jgi:ElaB/YqjD/DUF883 family membrane-anchored ribosome-binding protein